MDSGSRLYRILLVGPTHTALGCALRSRRFGSFIITQCNAENAPRFLQHAPYRFHVAVVLQALADTTFGNTLTRIDSELAVVWADDTANPSTYQDITIRGEGTRTARLIDLIHELGERANPSAHTHPRA